MKPYSKVKQKEKSIFLTSFSTGGKVSQGQWNRTLSVGSPWPSSVVRPKFRADVEVNVEKTLDVRWNSSQPASFLSDQMTVIILRREYNHDKDNDDKENYSQRILLDLIPSISTLSK